MQADHIKLIAIFSQEYQASYAVLGSCIGNIPEM